MSFVQIQISIFLSIILSSLIAGKKGTFISAVVWALETFIVYKVSSVSYLQIITLALSFQLGLISGVVRDFIFKFIKKKKQTVENRQ